MIAWIANAYWRCWYAFAGTQHSRTKLIFTCISVAVVWFAFSADRIRSTQYGGTARYWISCGNKFDYFKSHAKIDWKKHDQLILRLPQLPSMGWKKEIASTATHNTITFDGFFISVDSYRICNARIWRMIRSYNRRRFIYAVALTQYTSTLCNLCKCL